MDTISVGKRLVLHLGVIIQPYRSVSRSKKRIVRATDTGQVAQWLEDKYALMETFFDRYGARIGEAYANGFAGYLENILSGALASSDPFGQANSQVEIWFRNAIATQEAEHWGIPGTPTKAALMGVNHRLKHPYRRSNPRRPSFLDTGLYMGNFKVWWD